MMGTILQIERIRRLANDWRISMEEIRVIREHWGGEPTENLMVSWPRGNGKYGCGLIEKDGRMHT